MTLIDDLRHLQNNLPEGVDISSRIEKIELAAKMGATPVELLMQVFRELEDVRKKDPDKYDTIRPLLKQLSCHLEGKQKFVWEKIFAT